MRKLYAGIVLILALCIGAAFYIYVHAVPKGGSTSAPQSGETIASSSATSNQGAVAKTPPVTVPPGFVEYKNDTYGFSLYYPKGMEVQIQPENERTSTIIFQDVEKGEGFQLYIGPYLLSQITLARFKKDVPSGVRLNTADFEIDGAVGASFDSTDATLGDTHEVWFIKNNLLFEATALRTDASQLDTVIGTVRFNK